MLFRTLVLIAIVVHVGKAARYFVKENELADTWRREGQERLRRTLSRRSKLSKEVAKNVILFIGDGMGVSTVTATRIYKGQLLGKTGEEYELTFEAFPHVGIAKTYEIDAQVPDSAGTATALLSGAKTNLDVVGLDARVTKGECDPVKYAAARLDNVVDWSHAAGKHTGIVTTTRITHATPATAYAHISDRYWECDAKIPQEFKSCTKDVARQLVEDEPGRSVRVLLGGGLAPLGLPVPSGSRTPHCQRQDGMNLVKKWNQGPGRRLFINNSQDLMKADFSKVDYLLGVFSPDHLPYFLQRGELPTLSNMTRQAIKLLSRNPKGYFLLVEGGNIDNAHHDNLVHHALAETAEMDDAVAVALEVTNPHDTLVIVTADHSHTLTIAGYPDRGSDILGRAILERDPIAHHQETLTYANGPAFDFHLKKGTLALEWPWRELLEDDLRNPEVPHFAGWWRDKSTHAGEDVTVYATGPNSDLVSGVFEQNYIAHVIGFAACIGPGITACSATGLQVLSVAFLIVVASVRHFLLL